MLIVPNIVLKNLCNNLNGLLIIDNYIVNNHDEWNSMKESIFTKLSVYETETTDFIVTV